MQIMNSGKVVLGVLAGLAAGAALGVLFAPEKGSVIRQNISDKTNGYADELKSKFGTMVDGISEKYSSLKNGYSNLKEDAMDLAQKGKSMYNDTKKDLKSASSDSKYSTQA